MRKRNECPEVELCTRYLICIFATVVSGEETSLFAFSSSGATELGLDGSNSQQPAACSPLLDELVRGVAEVANAVVGLHGHSTVSD